VVFSESQLLLKDSVFERDAVRRVVLQEASDADLVVGCGYKISKPKRIGMLIL